MDDALFKRGLIVSLAITGGLCLILWVMPSMLLDFRSSFDAQYQLPDWYYNALLMDRASLASADAMRSLIFILLGAALLFWYYTVTFVPLNLPFTVLTMLFSSFSPKTSIGILFSMQRMDAAISTTPSLRSMTS